MVWLHWIIFVFFQVHKSSVSCCRHSLLENTVDNLLLEKTSLVDNKKIGTQTTGTLASGCYRDGRTVAELNNRVSLITFDFLNFQCEHRVVRHKPLFNLAHKLARLLTRSGYNNALRAGVKSTLCTREQGCKPSLRNTTTSKEEGMLTIKHFAQHYLLESLELNAPMVLHKTMRISAEIRCPHANAIHYGVIFGFSCRQLPHHHLRQRSRRQRLQHPYHQRIVSRYLWRRYVAPSREPLLRKG